MNFTFSLDITEMIPYNQIGNKKNLFMNGEMYMSISEAQQRAVYKYTKAHYDEVTLRVPKGQKKIIQAHAASRGESTNAFIFRAIQEQMKRDGE